MCQLDQGRKLSIALGERKQGNPSNEQWGTPRGHIASGKQQNETGFGRKYLANQGDSRRDFGVSRTLGTKTPRHTERTQSMTVFDVGGSKRDAGRWSRTRLPGIGMIIRLSGGGAVEAMRFVVLATRMGRMCVSLAARAAVVCRANAATVMMDCGQNPTTNQVGEERQRGDPTLHVAAFSAA